MYVGSVSLESLTNQVSDAWISQFRRVALVWVTHMLKSLTGDSSMYTKMKVSGYIFL